MIGFVIPLDRELKELLPFIQITEEKLIQKRKIFEGHIGGMSCATVLAGHGKIKSAAGTQLLLSHYDCRQVFHLGSGGALSKELKIGDIVLGKEILEHDYLQKFGGKNKPPIYTSNLDLLNLVISFAETRKNKVHAGRIISGNEDVVTSSRRDELFDKYGGLSVDWESCGCAAICNLVGVPVLIARTISDYAYENTNNEYFQHAKDVNKHLAKFITEFIQSTL